MAFKIPLVGGMSRKWLLISLAAAVVVYAGLLLATRHLTQPAKPGQPEKPSTEVKAGLGMDDGQNGLGRLDKLTLPEAQVMELREEYYKKLQDLSIREKQLEAQENRIMMLEESLQKQAQSIQDEQTKLDAAAKRIRQAKEELRRTRELYTRQEKLNCREQAEQLEYMDAEQAAETLESWCMQGDLKKALLTLDMMDNRKAGRAIAEIKDPKLRAMIMERSTMLTEDAQGTGPPK